MSDEQHDDTTPDERPLTTAEVGAAATYHAPPASIPREAMWAAIQRQRQHGSSAVTAAAGVSAVIGDATTGSTVPVQVTPTTRGALRQMRRWSALAATAAVLVIGVTLVRTPKPITTTPTTETGETATRPTTAWQVASSEHFGDAESMLATLSTSDESQGDRQMAAWSRDLLASTRLLIDSPAGRDPKRRQLLLDLELVLVQLVESGPAMRTEDRTMLDELLTRSALLLTRIRTTVPAGMPATHD